VESFTNFINRFNPFVTSALTYHDYNMNKSLTGFVPGIIFLMLSTASHKKDLFERESLRGLI